MLYFWVWKGVCHNVSTPTVSLIVYSDLRVGVYIMNEASAVRIFLNKKAVVEEQVGVLGKYKGAAYTLIQVQYRMTIMQWMSMRKVTMVIMTTTVADFGSLLSRA